MVVTAGTCPAQGTCSVQHPQLNVRTPVRWCALRSTPLSILPFAVVKGARAPGLDPFGDAVGVVRVAARPSRDVARFGRCRVSVCLAVDAEVYQLISADGAIVLFSRIRPIPYWHLMVMVTKTALVASDGRVEDNGARQWCVVRREGGREGGRRRIVPIL